MSNITYAFSIQGPSCANQCTNNNITNECKASNECMCQNAQWSQDYACCVQQACNSTDFATSVQNWKDICLMEVVPPVTVSLSSCVPTATPTNAANIVTTTPASSQATQSLDRTSDSSTDSSMPTMEKYEIGIGVGVGVPVVIALIMMIVICVRIHKRRRRSPSRGAYNMDRVYGTSAENLQDHAYLNQARSVPTTMYANPTSPLDSILRSNTSIPLPSPTMNVPLVLSRDARKTLAPPIIIETPPAFEAYHPSKHPTPVTQALKPDPRLSEHTRPNSPVRPDSSSSYYSEDFEKEPYELAP